VFHALSLRVSFPLYKWLELNLYQTVWTLDVPVRKESIITAVPITKLFAGVIFFYSVSPKET
jgi:hypothetical protein